MHATQTLLMALMLALAGLTIAAPNGDAPSVVGPETVRLIESKVVMPGGASPLADYDRFYMLRTFTPKGTGPRDVVEGRFMSKEIGVGYRRTRPAYAKPVPGIPDAFTIERGGTLPNVADGGCSVVTIFFDVTSARLIEIQEDYDGAKPELAVCNGHA